jgi:hypothetical protein
LDYEGAAPNHVAQFGYEVRLVSVDGLSSTENNAAQIRDYIGAVPAEDAERPIILLGYSKGTPDILTALVSYPQLQERVLAAVRAADPLAVVPGAVGASQAGVALSSCYRILTMNLPVSCWSVSGVGGHRCAGIRNKLKE